MEIPIFDNPKDVKILIVGDSTAVGTGARYEKDTIAGRLRRDFPNAEIVNAAVNGSLIEDVPRQLSEHKNTAFNIIFISTGGNDIWHFTRVKKIRHNLEITLEIAKKMSNYHVILLLYNNIGDAPAFSMFVFKALLRRRGELVHSIFRDISHKAGIPYIELFSTEKENNPFMNQKKYKKLFAVDGTHPSGDGYGLWYNRMWREMVRYGYRSGIQ